MSTLALVNVAARHNARYSGLSEPSHANYPLVHELIDKADDTSLGLWRTTIATYERPAVDFPLRLLEKFGYSWVAVDFWDNVRLSYLRRLSPWLGLCVVWWGVLAPWAAVGSALALARREHRRALLPLVLAFLALGPGIAVAAGVFTRYRMVAEPLACVLFATAIVDTARAIRRRQVLGAVLLVVGLSLHGACRDRWQPPLPRSQLVLYANTFPHPAAKKYLAEQAERSSAR
jgi:hypothetical protein